MNSLSNSSNSPTLPTNGSEQDQQPNIVPPARRERKARTETSTRHTWSKEDNIQLMTLYYQSQPSRSGYRRRLRSLWDDAGLFTCTEQRLADQARSIRNNNLLSDIELLEIRGTLPPSVVEEAPTTTTQALPTVSQAIRTLRDATIPTVAAEELTPTTTVPDFDKEAVIERLKRLLEDPSVIETKPLRHVNRKKLMEGTSLINSCIAEIPTSSITETNTLLLAGAHLVSERLGEKPANKNTEKRKTPLWKRRIEDKITQVRKDISYLEEKKKGTTLKQKILEGLNRRHPLLKKKGIPCIIEELKQRLRAKAAKIKRFNKRCERYHQNKLFGNNQRQFYRNLQTNPEEQDISHPEADKDSCLKFWKNIWEQPVEHNSDAEWLPDVRTALASADEQRQFVITNTLVADRVRKMTNWSSPGTDGLHAYWIKHFKELHNRIADQLMNCLTNADIPDWMTLGRTYLLIKDHSKGPIPGNFRPITCLSAMWKLFTGLISDSIYHHLDQQKLLPPEQKGCKKKSRGCKEQLMIDKLILQNCKRRKRNLNMTFIDYKKAYDSVPHSWILSCLTMCGISSCIIDLFEASFKQSYVNLMLGKVSLGRIKINRGLFQGDSVSPIHFIISLIPLSILLNKHDIGYSLERGGQPKVSHRLYMDDLKLYAESEDEMQTLVNTTAEFSSDIKMEFGLEKCAVVKVKKGARAVFEGISLPTGEQIHELEDDGYKYLGILEANDILHKEMKALVTKEYIRRVKKVLKSQLHGRNSIQAINTWAVPVIRYGAGILSWNAGETKALDVKTRKLMRIHGAHHPQGDVDRLYVSRQLGGRGLHSIEEVVKREENALTTYVVRSRDPELIALKDYFVKDKILLGEEIEKDIDRTQREEIRKEKWTAKVMHGQFPRQMMGTADPLTSWNWLTQQDLKKETEGLLIAAQDQALRTNYVKHRIDKTPGSSPLCRLCRNHYETIDHILNGCPKLSQTEYKCRHDKVAAALHWSLCKECGFPRSKRWYEHRAEKVLENGQVKILWDFHVQSDHVIEHCRPDLLLVDKVTNAATIIDVAVPGDTRILDREQEKILKYQDLKREIKKNWNLRKVTIVPVVIGALGTITINFRKHLDAVHCNLSISNLQKTALLGSARILRMVLDI